MEKNNCIYAILLVAITLLGIGKAAAQCTDGSAEITSWTHQAATTYTNFITYQPYPGAGSAGWYSTYDESGTFTTTDCTGDQVTMGLNFTGNSDGNTDGQAGVQYAMVQRFNASSSVKLTFTNPVLITNFVVGDIDQKSSYVDKFTVTAKNSSTNVDVTISTNSYATASGNVVSASGGFADVGQANITTLAPVTELTIDFVNGNSNGGDQILMLSNLNFCCPTSCDAGTTAPNLAATTGVTECPTKTFNLNNLTVNNTPSNTNVSLKWFTSSALTTAVTNPSSVDAGTYYAAFYDSVNICYSPATSFEVLLDSDCDDIADINDLDADNDGIKDEDEAFACTTPSFKFNHQTYDFDASSALGEYSLVTAGNINTQTVGTYTVGSPVGEVYAAGKVINVSDGPLGTASQMMYAQSVTSTAGGAEMTNTTGVYNYAFQNNLRFRKQANKIFVVEYDLEMGNSVQDEYGTYISNGENGTVYTNTSNAYDAYSTYRMQLWSHVDGTRSITGTGYNYSASGSSSSWYRLKTEYTISDDFNTLTIENNLYKYTNGVLGTTAVNTTSYNVSVDTTTAQSWLVDGFQAGVLSDYKFDNVEMYWLVCDYDNDGVPNHLDLDSDNDGCPDATEGGSNLEATNIAGNNLSDGNGGVVTNNLPLPVGTREATMGIPTGAGTGQAIGTSQATATVATPVNLTGDLLVCSTSDLEIKFTADTEGTGWTYQLQKQNGSDWEDVSGASGNVQDNVEQTITTTAVAGTYRVEFTNTNNPCGAISTERTVTVIPESVAGTVSSDQTICAEETPAALTLSGHTGDIQWQQSTTSATTGFSNISGANIATYTPGALSATTYYRVVVTSGNCSSATSNVVTITTEICPCEKDGVVGDPRVTKVGVSTLDRNVENWLNDNTQNQLGAYLATESTTKGFVITRNANPEGNISNAEEGMMVWDTTDKCLKLYDGTQWKCISKGCNE